MKVLAFGEILFDVYDTAYKLGGAPLNFCAHLAKLGADSYILSAVGKDKMGDEAIEAIQKLNVSTAYIERNNQCTGACRVTYEGNEPQYHLDSVSAYDSITAGFTDRIQDEKFDLFYFGTLAQRNKFSQNTLYQLLETVNFGTVFYDMNLRRDCYDIEKIKKSLYYANIVKVNRTEFEYLKEIFNLKGEDKAFIKKLCAEYSIQTMIITLDESGVWVYNDRKGFCKAEASKVKVVSAVGAGDSFCACFMYHLYRGERLEQCARYANALAGYVVGFEEAIPSYTDELVKQIHTINLPE